MRTRLEELERLASDLANVNTSGYKIERSATAAAERERFLAELESAVDVVGAGSRIDVRPGTLTSTGRELDVAIEGSGFFEVLTPGGPRYTRSGAFTRRADGVLTTMDGYPVAGEKGEIRVEPGAITIDPDGTVHTGTTVAGRLKVVDFDDPATLSRESGARFRAAAPPKPAIDARTIGGALEQSNVSVVDRMATLTAVSRSFEGLQRGVSVLMNDVDGRAISELGRR
jgi:flagellar basal body rod protein FlgG